MGLDTEQERKAVVIQRSWWLAMTGWYAKWQEVEARLVALGYTEAPRWLSDPELRRTMDRVCMKSRDAAGSLGMATSAPGSAAERGRS